jgi:hypothetical protein
MRRAIVTLCIGQGYLDGFNSYCRNNWQAYGQKIGCEVLVIGEPLDTSDRAKSRSPAWQKCLVPQRPELAGYDQIAWVDADILFNVAEAPSVFDGVPLDKIGGVEATSFTNRAIYLKQWARQQAQMAAAGIKFTPCYTNQDWYRQLGLTDSPPEDVLQTGVMVFSPRHHAALFRHVYDRYEDPGPLSWNLEMRPLSYEIIRRGLAHWIDHRFNTIPLDYITMHYPFIARDAMGPPSVMQNETLLRRCIETVLSNSYFLHFAGVGRLIRLTRGGR